MDSGTRNHSRSTLRLRLPESPPGQGRIPEVYSHICDPFVAMSLAAAVTTRLKLATGVMLVPERNPIVAAKEIATLDHFSGGRVMLGIGAGWLKEESEILGAIFRIDGARPKST